MNLGSGKGISKRSSGTSSDDLADVPERLVELARDYFSSDFSNPSRTDCPDQSALDGLILSKALPDDELRTHLFECSDCFRDYSRLLARRRDTSTTLSWWDTLAVPFRRQPLTAFACLVLITIGVVAVLLILRGRQRETQTSVVKNAPQPALATTPTATAEAAASAGNEPQAPETSTAVSPPEKEPGSPGGDKKRARPRQELVASNTITIDLENYSLLRGGAAEGAGSEEPVVSFPAARSRLVLALPPNSPRGLYKLSIVDPYGRELSSRKAASTDGKRLVTELDTRSLSTSKYRLCVSLPAEAPDCYPFVVTRK